MTTGCWQHYKDNRRGMSNLHHVTCPRSNISGCQPGESKVEKTCQAGYSLWLGRQLREPCSPFNTNINHTIGTVILFHFSLSLPLCPVGHRQRLTRSFWFLFGHLLESPTQVQSQDCKSLVFLPIGAHLHQLKWLCTADLVGLRSWFQLFLQKTPV